MFKGKMKGEGVPYDSICWVDLSSPLKETGRIGYGSQAQSNIQTHMDLPPPIPCFEFFFVKTHALITPDFPSSSNPKICGDYVHK